MASLLFASSALGCGGSGKPAQKAPSSSVPAEATDVPDAQASETPEAKFARQSADTVGKMCERLIDCSIVDAQQSMEGEELEKLNRDLPGITAKARSECEDTYNGAGLSPRQVIALRECLGQPSECPEYNECLMAATGGASGG